MLMYICTLIQMKGPFESILTSKFTVWFWLPGLRMLDQPYMTDLIEANSMGHQPDDIHIYSASWGPTDDGKTVDGPRNATMRAIVKGVNEVLRYTYSFCASIFSLIFTANYFH